MKFTVNDFDRFWEAQGSSLNLRNAERLRKSLRESVAECGSTEKLDDHVLSLTSRKETARRVIAEFYRFIGVDSSDTVLYGLRFYDEQKLIYEGIPAIEKSSSASWRLPSSCTPPARPRRYGSASILTRGRRGRICRRWRTGLRSSAPPSASKRRSRGEPTATGRLFTPSSCP